MKHLFYFAVILGSCSIISCQDDTLELLSDKGIEVNTLKEAASRSIQTDDDKELIYRLQTDQIGMLINSIQKVDSAYVITLSAEDAKALGIPDSTYALAESILANYNTNLTK